MVARRLLAPLHPPNRTPILNLHPNRKIIAVDVERNLHILMVQVRSTGIVKARYFATR